MTPRLQYRTGLLVSVTALHIGTLWWLMSSVQSQPVTPPTPLPMVMAEMLPVPESKPEPPRPQAQPQPQSQPQPKTIPKPVTKPQPKPAPKTTDSEKALTAPKPAEQPRAQAPTSTPEPATPASPSPTAPPVPSAPPAPAAPPAPLTPPRFNASYLNNPPPTYPPLMRRAGEEGRVMLRVYVTPEGTAGEVRVLTPSSSSLFDEAAMAAVRKWRFVPAKRGDTPVAEWVQVPIEFKLN